MKNIIRRGLAWVLVLCMVFSLVPGAAMPVRAEEGAPTVNGEYTDGAWNQGGSGTVTYNVDGTDVTLSKTAQAVEGMENTYDVTLTVKTSTSSSVRTNSGAVVLVIDTSSSMQSCANCGSRTGHASGCTDRSQNRLQAAKVAAREFLSSYAGSDANATRMLAIVTFDGGYRTNMSWSNVAGGSGSNSYDSALSTINGLSYATGTNMEGGLKLALDLLGSSAVSGFGSMNVVLLSDGAPSQRIGNSDLYGSNKADCDAAANQAAAIRATGSKLYTVCFGAARDNAYDDVTVSSFLSGRIASSGCAYDADNASQLNAAFRAITESITSGLSGKGWTVTDPMAPHISVSGGTGDSFYKDGAHYTWELSNVSTQTEGNTTYYIYTYTYRVTFDPQFEGFVEGDYYPTNEETYLNIEGKQYEFPVPGVKARLPRRDVTVTKVWNDEGNQDGIRPTSVTVQLMEGERAIGEPVVLNADNGWSYTWDGDTYDLIYKSEGKVHVYTVVELDTHKEYTASATFENSQITLTNTHEVYRKDITVTKKWDDKNNQDGIRPKAITVNLLANGTVVATAELTAPDWSYTFRGFEVNEDGREITYTVEEVNVPEGYTASVDGLTVTNKHEVEKTSVSVKKIWDDNDNQDGLRPNDVTFRLLANGVDTGKTLVITGSSWTGTFTDLDKFANGKEIVYTVEEVTVPTGYTATASGLTVTNKHVPSVISVSGSKTWVDGNNQDGVRPESITVHLKANGVTVATKTVTEADGWAWSFENLPEFEAGKRITYTVVEDAVEDYSTTYNGYNITNTHTPAELSVTVSKVWDDNQNQDGLRSNVITVHLLANGVDTGKTLELTDGNGWTGSFTNLPKFENGREITYTIAEVSVEGYTTVITGTQAEGFTITNTHETETVSVSGSKTWVDADNQDGARPESITINLVKNGEVIASKTVTEADGWAWSFENLPKYENGGQLIRYSITENTVEDYTTEYNGFNVINTHAPAKTSVTVTKSWQDSSNQDGIRPNDITVRLLADGEDTGKTLVLSVGNGWTGTFGDLDKFAEGKEIVYSVEELTVPGYTTVITGDQYTGYTVTNSHTPETVSVSGSKTWNDNDNQDGFRPASITINLLADGEVIKTVTVTEADGWAWSFVNLPKYRNEGIQIVYSVTEDAVADYTTTYDGYNVTNSHTPEELSITVSKAWSDSDNQDGIRPKDITVELLANGESTGKSLVLSSGNEWRGTFTELPKYENGEEIVYSVREITVEGYTTVITGDKTTGFTITNSHNPETVEVSGKKTWNDNNNQDGFRPESITINLLADGEVIETVTVTEADGWAWSFENLPKYRDQGTLIVYSVTEDAVKDYSTEYNGTNVTNTHTPEQTSVTVSKQWVDSNDQDGIQPEHITVVLLANGEATKQTLTLNAGNGWTGSFTELDKFENGVEIVYSVAEVSVEGYTTTVTGDQYTGYHITNTHTPETVAVSGAKTWVDADNQDGFRPESITINLLADGAVIDTVTVTEADNWSWSFENLPKYRDHGTLIVYSVTEEAIDEYSTEYNGFNVTNTHAPEKTSVTVSKVWDDSNNQDGIRANDVTVVLLANGENTGKSLVLSSGNGWTGSFTELDKYEGGEVITYTVQELQIAGYASVITGNQTEGYRITNTHTPETVAVSGTKTWVDADNQDGFRPESITINLLADGAVIDTITVTEADNWSWSFENLPKYRNEGILIVYSVTEEAVEDYSTEYNGFNVTNSHTPEQTSVTVSKAWQDADDQDGIRPNDITVALLANGENTGKTLVLNAGNGWTGSFTELDKYEAGAEIVYSVAEIAVEGYETVITGDQYTGYSITNSHNPETVAVAGTKSWDDADNQDGFRPESITINLLADGAVIDTVTVTEESGWSWSFENLPKYRDHGILIQYSVTEEAVEDYVTTYNNYDVVNTHAPEKTSVTVSKVWADSDDQDGIRANDVTVILLANGEETGLTLVLNNGNNWTDSFTDLDKYENGVEIVYTVREAEVQGYETVITGDQYTGYTVTNSHTPETVAVAGEKTWKDHNNQDGVRPESITINLLSDGVVIETIEVTEESGWSWSFENLPKYRDHGVEIVYAITENVVEDYSTEYDGYDVINKHAPEQTSVTVSKSWQDSDDQDGIRPEDIEVILLADGEETGKKLKLNADNNWTDSFTKLDKFRDGVEIVYTVAEIAVEGYETVITGDRTTGFIITNSHTTETIEVAGAKTWNDNNNQDGKRPASITINLLADGEVIQTVTVTEENGWAWSFSNLPKFKNGGVEIVYSITENAVEGYTTTYDGYNVTNSYTPEEISITVAKAWADTDNKEGMRPKSITVLLYADGKLLEQTLVVTAEGNWVGSFTGLPKYENGKEIVYTIGEVSVDGYNTIIRGDMAKGFSITNSRTYIPKTGDSRAPILWMLLMAGSAAMAYLVLEENKRRKMSK